MFSINLCNHRQHFYTKAMKKSNIYKGFLDFEDEFDHRYACWAYNHRGWAKMKKSNKRLAKKRERNNWKKEAKEYER
jgi:hypothetical protein